MLKQPAKTDGIASKASVCLAQFQVVTELAANDSELQHVAPSLEDQNARLRVYIRNIGADRDGNHRGSLEYRLRDSSNIRLRVLQFLASLLELLEDAKCLFDESEPNRLTEMKDALKHISKAITCLMRLSMVIQSSTPRRRFSQSQYTRVEQGPDINHVAGKYKLSSKQLQERMGKANSYRREYHNYRKAHHYRIAHGSDLDTEGQSTVASSLPRGLDGETLGLEQLNIGYDDPAWELSSQSTTYDADQFDFPPIPEMSKHGPFECPFCYMIIAVDSQKTWEKHLIHDIRPYMCLDNECPITEHYETRREWIQHMQQKHWQTWVCPKGCHQVFGSSKEFRSHIMKLHIETWESKGWDPNFENACSRPLAGWDEENCPFCFNHNITSIIDYKNHVGDHQLDLARFVLPRMDYEPAHDEPTQDESTAQGSTADEPAADEASNSKSSQDLQGNQAPLASASKDPSNYSTAAPIRSDGGKRHDASRSGEGAHIEHRRNKKAPSSIKSSNLRWICGNCDAGQLSYTYDLSCPFCGQPRGPGSRSYAV